RPTDVSGIVGTLRQFRADAVAASHDPKKVGFKNSHGVLTVEARDKTVEIEFGSIKNNEQMVKVANKLFIFRHGRLNAMLSACERHMKSTVKAPPKNETPKKAPPKKAPPKKVTPDPKKIEKKGADKKVAPPKKN
ncbi:MAG: hypothetical protein P1V97_25795, partial [Planctomycetota bacterium]|nr:hypothetical protein [Planctomycetota bacterium]